jgi:hypothetical protein
MANKRFKLKVRRQSSRANRLTGNYSYVIESPEIADIIAEFDPQGIREGDDGEIIMFSRSMVGEHQKSLTVEVEVRSGKDRAGNTNNYLNIVDKNADKAGRDLQVISQNTDKVIHQVSELNRGLAFLPEDQRNAMLAVLGNSLGQALTQTLGLQSVGATSRGGGSSQKAIETPVVKQETPQGPEDKDNEDPKDDDTAAE